jgi:hypothetical protein
MMLAEVFATVAATGIVFVITVAISAIAVIFAIVYVTESGHGVADATCMIVVTRGLLTLGTTLA